MLTERLVGRRFRPPCECVECLKQYRAHSSQDYIPFLHHNHLEASKASNLAKSYTQSILEDLDLLRRHIHISGEILLKRWRRRTPSKRRDLLLQVEPDLYPSNVPLIDLAERLIGKTLGEQERYRYAYIAPYLNIDLLSSDWCNLIRLLHYRTSSQPGDWVSTTMHRFNWPGTCSASERSLPVVALRCMGNILVHGNHSIVTKCTVDMPTEHRGHC